MMQVSRLTILYTQHIGGDLHLLPRLYTFLQSLQAEHSDAPVLILDIGDSCSPEIWHCQVTQGRSTFLVLDAMGYHAANSAELLSDSERDRLQTMVTTGLVNQRHAWRFFVPPFRDETIIVASAPTPALRLCIVASPSETTRFELGMLFLASVPKAHVGIVTIDIDQSSISQSRIVAMPNNSAPSATISASVELVEEEAQSASNRQS